MGENTQSQFDYIVIGLGKTGISCLHYLMAKGYQVAATDSRETPPNIDELKKTFPKLTIKCGELSAELIQAAKCLVVSPGVSLQHPCIQAAIAENKPVIGDIELFAKAVKVPTIGITGSNGKTTVTTLLGEMAKKTLAHVMVAGNIGVPVLEVVTKPADLFVLELSSFQLETTHSLRLIAATILNVTENHMDRYECFQAYVEAKQRIYQHAAMVVCNRQDANTFPLFCMSSCVTFGLDQPATEQDFGVVVVKQKKHIVKGKQALIAADELLLQGEHNLLNAMAALALGEAVGLPMPTMLETLRDFKGLKHRCEFVTEQQKIRWYNDSKATTVTATLAAIKMLGVAKNKQLILIAGGVGKDADFTDLKPFVQRYVKALILFGRDADQIEQACLHSTIIYHVDNLAAAVAKVNGIAEAGNTVLLSPACASLDMFENYEHRGEAFIQLVKEQFNARD